ncbi:MAG: helix-turn-helix transcriptional regulator [Actinomycetota bacterium]
MNGRVLSSLGVTELEERVYRALLTLEAPSPAVVAEVVGASQEGAHEACVSLERKGLVSRSGAEATPFMPAPPDVAIEVLILRKQEELEQVRLEAAQLTEAFRESRDRRSVADLLEVITGREAVADRFIQLQSAAKEEVMLFDVPPYAVPWQSNLEPENDLLRRGVHSLVVYDTKVLEEPGALDYLRRLGSAGEEARFFQKLPMKLFIVDRKVGLIPYAVGEEGIAGGIVLYSSSLLEALVMFFHTVWERASPLPLAETKVPDRSATHEPDDLDRALLVLMAAGMKDQAIARQLSLGLRTVERRVSEIMHRLRTQTRFQAAYEAVRQGWLPISDEPKRGGELREGQAEV